VPPLVAHLAGVEVHRGADVGGEPPQRAPLVEPGAIVVHVRLGEVVRQVAVVDALLVDHEEDGGVRVGGAAARGAEDEGEYGEGRAHDDDSGG